MFVEISHRQSFSSQTITIWEIFQLSNYFLEKLKNLRKFLIFSICLRKHYDLSNEKTGHFQWSRAVYTLLDFQARMFIWVQFFHSHWILLWLAVIFSSLIRELSQVEVIGLACWVVFKIIVYQSKGRLQGMLLSILCVFVVPHYFGEPNFYWIFFFYNGPKNKSNGLFKNSNEIAAESGSSAGFL